MAFALSGTTITQTGTDTDLSGLNGISEVATLTEGDHTIYNLGNRKLRINGDLTIDPEYEELVFGTSAPVKTLQVDTGTLTIGKEIVTGGSTNRFSSGVVARFTDPNTSGSSEAQSSFIVESGGTLHWYGGTIYVTNVIAFMEGSNVNIYSPSAIAISTLNGGINQIRQRSANTNIQGFTLDGFLIALIENPTAFNGIVPFSPPSGFYIASASGLTPHNVFLNFEDLVTTGTNEAVVGFWSDAWLRMTNVDVGSDFNAIGGITNATNQRGIAEVRQKLTVNTQTLDGTAIDGKVYTRDSDNGNRLAANTIESNPDYLADRIYQATLSGGAHTFDTDGGILTAVKYRTNSSGGVNDNNIDDYRHAGNNGDDIFSFGFANYNFLIANNNIQLKGNGGTEHTQTMFVDNLVTETNKSTVDAYTELETPQKFYDRAKAYLVDNYAGETATVVARSGTTIDAGLYNVIVDATATPAFAFDGTTITIHADTFTGSITTTGTVTTANGAVVNGIVSDANGTTGILELL